MTESSTSSTSNDLYNQISSEFKSTVLKEVLKMLSSNSKLKVNEEVADAMCKLMKVMVVEASARAIKEAKKENRNQVTLDDVEVILVQMMLDFP